jgi:hypothetical protein
MITNYSKYHVEVDQVPTKSGWSLQNTVGQAIYCNDQQQFPMFEASQLRAGYTIPRVNDDVDAGVWSCILKQRKD